MTGRSYPISVLSSFFSVFLLTLMFSSPGITAEKVKLGTGLKGVIQYELPLFAAEEKGSWKEKGLELEFTPFTGGGMVQALAAGALDVGLAHVAMLIPPALAGVPITIVADLRIKEAPFAIWVRADSPVKKPDDLKGAKIGTAKRGESAHNYGLLMVKALGLEKDVKFLVIGGIAERLAGVKTGAIDAFVLTSTPIANLVAKGEVRQVVNTSDFLPRNWMAYGMSAHSDFIVKKAGLIGNLIKVLIQSGQYVKKDMAWTLAKLRSGWRYDEKAAMLVFNDLSYGTDARIDREALQNVVNFLAEYEIVQREKIRPVDELYTNRFVN